MTTTLPRPPADVEDVTTLPAADRTSAAARLRGRWRVAMQYGRRDARRAKGRTALVAVLVLLPVLVGSLVATTAWSQRQTPERMVAGALGPLAQAYASFEGMPLEQVPDMTSFGSSAGAPQRLAVPQAAAALDGVLPAGSEAHLVLMEDVVVHGPHLQSTGWAAQADLSVPALAARWPVADGAAPAAGEVALRSDLADQLGVGIGDDVSLHLSLRHSDTTPSDLGTLRVSGLLLRSAWHSVVLPDGGPLRPPSDAASGVPSATWFITGDEPVTWSDVRAANAAGFTVFSRAVVLDPPPASDIGLRGPETGDFLRQWGLVIIVAAVGLLEAAFLIGPAFAVSARRSTRTLALVAANGGSPADLRALLLGSAAVIGVVASVAGALLGVGVAAVVVARSPGGIGDLSIPWAVLGAIVAIGVLLTVGGALLPARSAAKQDVVSALAGRRSEPVARRWPAIVGAVLGAVGYAAAIVGGLQGTFTLVLAGVVVGQIGVLLAVGGIVALLGRLAARFPLSARLAVRDASRHRRRSSPAIAAVVVAVAGATAGLTYLAAEGVQRTLTTSPRASEGIVTVAWDKLGGGDGLTADEISAIRAVVAEVTPQVGELLEVPVLSEKAASDGVALLQTPPGRIPPSTRGGAGFLPGPLVDDGSLAHLLGFGDDTAAVRDALAAGQAVTSGDLIFDDGTLRVAVEDWGDVDWDAGPEVLAEVRTPAVVIGDPRATGVQNLPILPPQAAAELAAHGVDVIIGGLVAAEPAAITRAESITLETRIAEIVGTDEWGSARASVGPTGVSETFDDAGPLIGRIIFGASAVLALAAAWISAALAATESRPDLATLTAVGAAPRTRKRFVAAQAGTIVVIGTVLGAASGLALGAAVVLDRRHTPWGIDYTWGVEIPWLPLAALVVGLPVLAMGAAWLVTRARLTLTARTAA